MTAPSIHPASASETSLKSVASSASLLIYNIQTKGAQHKSIVKPALKSGATPPGQLIALQTINALKETISG